jgi:hypothetical protein
MQCHNVSVISYEGEQILMNDVSGVSAMDHVIGAEGSAYKALYRPGEGKTRNGKACGKYIFCLSRQ